MRDRISRYARVESKALIFAAPLMLVASAAMPGGLDRLSAEFQSQVEIATVATPAASPVPGNPGGVVVYDKTLNIPPGVAYVKFSAQGDTHEQLDGTGTPIPGTGAALLMTASITDAAGNVTTCQLMA